MHTLQTSANAYLGFSHWPAFLADYEFATLIDKTLSKICVKKPPNNRSRVRSVPVAFLRSGNKKCQLPLSCFNACKCTPNRYLFESLLALIIQIKIGHRGAVNPGDQPTGPGGADRGGGGGATSLTWGIGDGGGCGTPLWALPARCSSARGSSSAPPSGPPWRGFGVVWWRCLAQETFTGCHKNQQE